MKRVFFIKGRNWSYLIFHPITLAIVIALVTAWFIFPRFEGFKAELVSKENSTPQCKIIYADLDHDGNSEKIKTAYYFDVNFPGITVFSNSEKIFEQWNLTGEFLDEDCSIIGDYNHNNSEEIYVFTRETDSIFLNSLELFTPNGLELKRRFITKTKPYNENQYDVKLAGSFFWDVDKDGQDELIFNLYAGYSLQPRKLFVYDIKKDSIISSPKSASGIKANFEFMDIDNDSNPEVTGFNHAAFNFHSDFPYPDSLSWHIVYKTDGNFLFEPYAISGSYSQIMSTFVSINNKSYLLSLIDYRQDYTSDSNFKLELINPEGIKIKERNLKINNKEIKSPGIALFHLNEEKMPILYFILSNQFYTIDSSLDLHLRKSSKIDKLERLSLYDMIELDIDGDDNLEKLFETNNQGVRVFRNNLKQSIFLPKYSTQRSIVSLKFEKGKPTLLSISNSNYHLLYNYHKNPYAWLKFPLVFLIFILSYMLFYFLVKIQKQQLEKRYAEEKQINKYQFQGLRNQLDPHFALNILNSIQSLFYQKNFNKAKYLLAKYGKLNRSALQNADKIAISLEDELEFVENYLALEKFRYDDKFEYFIKMDETIEVEIIEIPRMLIHTFVENAVKHGLFPKEKNGVLRLEITENETSLFITIEDNGIGRARSKALKTVSNGKGLSIIQEIVSLYNKLNTTNITYTTVDLFEEYTSVGTRVEIIIPI